MPKAGEIATELHRIADALEKEPETELARPLLFFYNYAEKQQFLDSVRLLPRPLKKSVDEHNFKVQCADDSVVWTHTTANRSAVCTVVKPAQPAVYDCEPLLSMEEEGSLKF